jgi:hypothetical protein
MSESQTIYELQPNRADEVKTYFPLDKTPWLGALRLCEVYGGAYLDEAGLTRSEAKRLLQALRVAQGHLDDTVKFGRHSQPTAENRVLEYFRPQARRQALAKLITWIEHNGLWGFSCGQRWRRAV